MDKDREVLEDNVRHSFMSVVWSHKIQEKEADIISEQFKLYELISIACTSLTSVGLISLIFVDQFWIKFFSAIVSFTSTFISLFFKSFDLQNSSSIHKKTALDLLVVRDKLRFLLLEIRINNNGINELLKKYEAIQNELDEIYMNAPNTTDKAVRRASEALKITKDNDFSEAEIDTNLPRSLQRREMTKNESNKI